MTRFKIGDRVRVIGVIPNGKGSTMYTSDRKLSEYNVSLKGIYTITEDCGENINYPYHLNNTRFSWCSEELIKVHTPKNVIGGNLL